MNMTRTIEQTETFAAWVAGLKDRKGQSIIAARVRRVSVGNVGNVKSLGEGLFEIKIDFGPGYRVYFVEKGETIILLLAGGDKSTQSRDIKAAKEMIQ